MNIDFKQFETDIDRIAQITRKDMKHKTLPSLLNSTFEEFGELSREIQIEDKVFGNTYKKIDEGSQMEAVDLLICGLAIYSQISEGYPKAKKRLLDTLRLRTASPVAEWLMIEIGAEIGTICKAYQSFDFFESVCHDATILLIKRTLSVYLIRGGSEELLSERINQKLDKWEENMKGAEDGQSQKA